MQICLALRDSSLARKRRQCSFTIFAFTTSTHLATRFVFSTGAHLCFGTTVSFISEFEKFLHCKGSKLFFPSVFFQVGAPEIPSEQDPLFVDDLAEQVAEVLDYFG